MPEPTPAQRAIGDFAPKLVDLTDEVLFGDIWERPELAKRDRSLITRRQPDHLEQLRAARGSSAPSQAERPHRDRTEGGDRAPGVLRRLAQGDVRDPGRQADLRRIAPSSNPTGKKPNLDDDE
jgi:hypothetical protein